MLKLHHPSQSIATEPSSTRYTKTSSVSNFHKLNFGFSSKKNLHSLEGLSLSPRPIRKIKLKSFYINSKEPPMLLTSTFSIKRLNNWDKSHWNHKRKDIKTLYTFLSNYYTSMNWKPEKEHWDTLNYLFYSKTNFKDLMAKSYSSNKILELIWGNTDKEQGAILQSKISKTKNKFYHSLNQNKTKNEWNKELNIDMKTINSMSSSKFTNESYNKIIKDKIKFENQLRKEWLDISNDIYNAKERKKKLEEQWSVIYKRKEQMIKEFNENKNKYKTDLLIFQDEYEKQGSMMNNLRKSSKVKLILSASRKNHKIENRINDLFEKWNENIKEINKELEECNLKIEINNYEHDFFKYINDELIKENRQYYLNILSRGYDSRNEGLVWVVRKLIEMQTNWEYHHFPKFWTYSQIDYLIKLANISLEEIQLKIIFRALKKKQCDIQARNNMKKLNKMNSFLVKIMKSEENDKFAITNRHKNYISKEDFESKMKIDHIFNGIYTRHEEAFKMFSEKQIEDGKLERLIYQIRLSLTGKECNEENVLKFFSENEDCKDIFNIILGIRRRIDLIIKERESLVQQEIMMFKEREKMKDLTDNVKTSIVTEWVKGCLFGNTQL